MEQIFQISIFLVLIGDGVVKILSIAGLTRTDVVRGSKTKSVYLAANFAIIVGSGMILILTMMNSSMIMNKIRCLLGG